MSFFPCFFEVLSSTICLWKNWNMCIISQDIEPEKAFDQVVMCFSEKGVWSHIVGYRGKLRGKVTKSLLLSSLSHLSGYYDIKKKCLNVSASIYIFYINCIYAKLSERYYFCCELFVISLRWAHNAVVEVSSLWVGLLWAFHISSLWSHCLQLRKKNYEFRILII